MSTQKSIQPVLNRLESIEGPWYLDKDKKILDLSGQTLNLSLGQPPKEVRKAVINQINNSVFFSSRFGSEAFDKLSSLLTDLSPKNMSSVNHKLSDGSDAVETAIKLGFENTRTMNIIALRDAWHGETMLTLQLSSNLRSKYLGAKLNVDFTEDSTLISLVKKVEETIIPSVVIVDPIGFSIGLFEYDDMRKFLPKLREACLENGHFLIFDEIQCFGGYLNGKFFSHELFNVECDAIAIGKALGQGFPISACLYSEDISELLYNEAEFTYGGQPPACAAAIAGIEYVIENKAEILKSLSLWNKFVDEIKTILKEEFSIRKVGFICSITPQHKEIVENLIKILYQSGLIVRKGNVSKSILLKAPITFNEDMYRWGILIFTKCVDEIKHIDCYKDYISFPSDSTINLKKIFKIKGVELKERSVSEQYNLFINLEKYTIPAPSVETKEFLRYKTLSGVPISNYKIKTIREAKTILTQIIDFMLKAHNNNIILGNRLAENTIWNGTNIGFVNFGVKYLGDIEYLKAFEHLFILLNHIIFIPIELNRMNILKPFIYEFLKIHKEMNLEEVFKDFYNFYDNKDLISEFMKIKEQV